MQKLSKKNKWSLHCNFCGKDVFKDPLDYYMVKNKIWNEICDNDYVSPTHILCRHCAEEILGREFIDNDFTDINVEEWSDHSEVATLGNYEYLDDGTKILKDEYYRKEK